MKRNDIIIIIMKEDEIIVQIQKINSAFENLSIERMEGLWKHEEGCIHPGWDLFTGWLAIRESWITIFRNTEMIKFIITDTKVRVSDNLTVVVCLENIETLVNREIVRLGVIATNIFEQMENQWLLIYHHGSSISNYIPPNISS
ncbi:MAG: nuclear transport factor 2 family protein [Candidatus Nitrosopolaris sp.]